MKKQVAAGFLPYEPGDKVEVDGFKDIYIIKEIKMSQYVVSGKVEFEVLVEHENNGNQIWIYPTKIKRRIV